MNFYAHLFTAAKREPGAEFALGAMLPDFATMAGFRLAPQTSARLAAGVQFHHDTDRVFHRLDSFRDHERWARTHMLRAGLRKGPARGVAHVAVELILDGALVGDERADALYLDALNADFCQRICVAKPDDRHRMESLVGRLQEFGVPVGYRDPAVVSDRLVRIMKPRPLLRLSEAEIPRLIAAIPELHERVSAAAGSIVSELDDKLAHPPAA